MDVQGRFFQMGNFSEKRTILELTCKRVSLPFTFQKVRILTFMALTSKPCPFFFQSNSSVL
jgi:hypothetical protein